MQQMCCMIAPLLQTMTPRLIYFLSPRERRSEDLFNAQGSKKGDTDGTAQAKKETLVVSHSHNLKGRTQ